MSNRETELLVALKPALKKAVAESWALLKQAHPDEDFYAFIIYTTPMFGYLTPSSNTEEALAATSEDPTEREELRWNPPDWKYHDEAQEPFTAVEEILSELDEVASPYCDDVDEDEWDEDDPEGYDAFTEKLSEERWGRRRDVVMSVLKELDAEGLWGSSDARDAIVVNIMWGDQDLIAHIHSARELNPGPAFRRYAEDSITTLKLWRDKMAGEYPNAVAEYNDDIKAIEELLT